MGRDADYLAYLRKVAQADAAESRGGRRSIAELRRHHADALRGIPRAPVGAVRDLIVGGAAGPMPARLYQPATDPGADPVGAADGVPPVLVFAHGGGWALGDVDAYDPVARALTVACRVAVISVDYRRPPEDPFPAPLDDLVAAVRWTRRHAGALGLDASRVGVAGDSAGGNLAAAAALVLRDAGDPPLAAQLLAYPAVDVRTVPPLPPDPDGLVFSDPDGRGTAKIRDLYLAGADPAGPLVSPLLAPDLAGLPPAVIATAEYDRLCAQGTAYAERLRAAGVTTTLIHGTGLDHGFLGYGAFARRPAQVIAQIGAAVHAAMTGTDRH